MKIKASAFARAALAASALAVSQTPAHAADDASFTLVSNQDAFFGFYQTFNGLMQLSEQTDFSFYGILWTTENFTRAAGAVGDGPWTEFGGGFNFRSMGGTLAIKPQIGVLNGSLLSGGTRTDASSGNAVFDGIVPSLTINYNDGQLEGEFYAGYYAATRNRDQQGLDFLHTWINGGVKVAPRLSIGGHYELLENSFAGGPAESGRVYQWVGGYTHFAMPKNVFARFTAGVDTQSDRGEFYKLAAGVTF